MTDILVPTGPADLIDQMIMLQSKASHAPDLALRKVYEQRLAQVQRVAADALQPLGDISPADITAARHDVMQLEADMRAWEAQSEFGLGFVALTRAYLEALVILEEHKLAYDKAFGAALTSANDTPENRGLPH